MLQNIGDIGEKKKTDTPILSEDSSCRSSVTHKVLCFLHVFALDP